MHFECTGTVGKKDAGAGEEESRGDGESKGRQGGEVTTKRTLVRQNREMQMQDIPDAKGTRHTERPSVYMTKR